MTPAAQLYLPPLAYLAPQPRHENPPVLGRIGVSSGLAMQCLVAVRGHLCGVCGHAWFTMPRRECPCCGDMPFTAKSGCCEEWGTK